MSSKDTHDESVSTHGKLNRRNMLLAGSTLAAASAMTSTRSSPEQPGASGAYSNSAIAMMPPGNAVPASKQEQILAAKIARAMMSGPREITKDATVAEMGADGNLIILRQGTNDWVCFPGDENEIGNVPMCANPDCLRHARRTCDFPLFACLNPGPRCRSFAPTDTKVSTTPSSNRFAFTFDRICIPHSLRGSHDHTG
jgi:hypothetical protein